MASERAFSQVYANKTWGDDAGLGAGPGSTPQATQALSALLAHVVLTYNISSMLDVPCGAMAWQPHMLDTVRRLRAVDGLDGRSAPKAANLGLVLGASGQLLAGVLTYKILQHVFRGAVPRESGHHDVFQHRTLGQEVVGLKDKADGLVSESCRLLGGEFGHF